MLKKRISCVIALGLCISLLGGCGSSSTDSKDQKSGGDKTVVTIFHHIEEQSAREGLEEVIKKLEEKNPGVDYELQGLDNSQYDTMLKTKLVGGDAPDIIMGTPKRYIEFIEAGHIYDISSEDFLKNYDEELLDSMKVDGKTYSVPTNCDSMGCYYIWQLQEWLFDYEETDIQHRHISHLYGLYPAQLIDIKDTKLAAACKTALMRRGKDGTGWCLAWKACAYARLFMGDEAFSLISQQLRYTEQTQISCIGGGTYANLFCAHPPFQIDGNFGITAAIAEMLIQSKDGIISLIPALPSSWNNGKVKGLRARGGYTVDFTWENHQVSEVTISADCNSNSTCRVLAGGQEIEVDFARGNSKVKLNVNMRKH